MKFGKQLDRQLREKWRPFYVSYKRLKGILKGVAGSGRGSSTFHAALREETARCSAFFVEKLEELEATLEAAAGDGDGDQSAAAFVEILELRRFGFLNFMAVTKAVKKHNKVAPCSLISAASVLLHQSFFSSPRLEAMAQRAESYLQHKGKAMERFSERERPATMGGPPPGLGAMQAPERLTVVLDLDHTLIFSVSRKSRLWRQQADNLSWSIAMDHQPEPVCVFPRPGLVDFLQALPGGCDLVIFTAGIEPYASPIIDKIEVVSGVKFSRRLYRRDTTRCPWCATVKDLSVLGTDLARTVLLDDNPLSFSLNPANAVPVLPWTGGVEDGDYLLEQLLPVVRDLQERVDVRPYLQQKYAMSTWFSKCGVPIPGIQQAAKGSGVEDASRPFQGMQDLIDRMARRRPVVAARV